MRVDKPVPAIEQIKFLDAQNIAEVWPFLQIAHTFALGCSSCVFQALSENVEAIFMVDWQELEIEGRVDIDHNFLKCIRVDLSHLIPEWVNHNAVGAGL